MTSPYHINNVQIGARSISGSNLNNAFRAIELCANIKFDPKYFKTVKSPAGILVTALTQDTEAEDESIWAFGMVSTATTCTVYSGSILFDKDWREYTTDTISMNGTPCYVYVSCNRVSYACTLKQANTKPTDAGDAVNLLIAEFTAVGGVYTLVRRHWRHSYNADANLPT
jgi:hypothetical protein